MSSGVDFRSTLTSLWFRLITLGIVGLVFAEILILAPGQAQGWSFYLSGGEVGFEVVVRLVFMALAGIALGTVCTAALTPFLWYFKSQRERIADWATKIAVVVVVFVDSRLALLTLIKWSYQKADHRGVIDTVLLAVFYVGFAVALCIPRTRKEVVSSLDGFLGEKMTRRTAMVTVAGTAALVATEYALGKRLATATAAVAARPKSNFLLVTFDAFCAEDTSLYGYRLPTTPNIDNFARKGTVFTKFFSGSTFTTPSVTTILTGVYPSESHVYQLNGHLRTDPKRSLPHLMRSAGYATGAFVSNPLAYYLAKGMESEFEVLPEPPFRPGRVQYLWDASTPIHQDSGFGSRLDEYFDVERIWNYLEDKPNGLSLRFRPVASFEHAREVLAKLPDGFFLWVHVMAPHDPYLPDPADRGRFLPDSELATVEEESRFQWRPHYQADQQSRVDRHRLAYDEYMASSDRAFGTFMADLEAGGRLRDTTVMVSADHGESFEGGMYQHGGPYQTRPVIHIPLIIRTPGQQESRKVGITADETAIAPTILELAGLPQPEWMHGQSLAPWLNRDGQGDGEGVAFCQYFEKNSIFKPLRHGTVGMIDGRSQYQYVLDLDTHKGRLRPLNEAQIWDLDRSAENPALAETLRAAIYARFPELVQKPT